MRGEDKKNPSMRRDFGLCSESYFFYFSQRTTCPELWMNSYNLCHLICYCFIPKVKYKIKL